MDTASCFVPTPLNGVMQYNPLLYQDVRGEFVKMFHAPSFCAAGIVFAPVEEFYSISKRGVIRGMHFQEPPCAHAKLVTCLSGRILDVVVDLRRCQPTFGAHWAVELNAKNRAVLFVPVGIAHGLLALTDDAVVHYSTSTSHNPTCDRGIRWDSFGMTWPVTAPIVSPRDAAFPTLADYASPF